MKKLLLILCLAGAAFATGAVQQSTSQLGRTDNWVVAFSWTGDSITGSVPSTAWAGSGNLGPQCCQGYLITQVEVVPGSPAPTSGYSVVVTDGAGVDILGGQGSSNSASAATSYAVQIAQAPLQGSLTLVIGSQSVASAKGTVYVFLSKPSSSNGNLAAARAAAAFSANCTAAAVSSGGIQAAIASLPATGGCVFAPPGVYTITPFTLTQSVRITGAGATSVIKLASGTNPGGAVIQNATPGTTLQLDHLTLDGNRANNTTTGPTFVYANGSTVKVIAEDLIFQNGNFTCALEVAGVSPSVFSNLEFINNTTHGLCLEASSVTTTASIAHHVVNGLIATYSQYSISGCTNATPIVCTTTAAHGFYTGQNISIAGASVATVNNQWNITVLTPTTFSLTTSTASGVSTGGTVYEGNFGLRVYNLRFVAASGVTIQKGGEGIQWYGAQDGALTGCSIDGTRDAGLTVFGDANSDTANNNNFSCAIQGTYFEGVYCGDKCVGNLFNITQRVAGASGIANRRSGMQLWGSSTANNLVSGVFTGNPEYGLNLRSSLGYTVVRDAMLTGNTSGAFFRDGSESHFLIDGTAAADLVTYAVISSHTGGFENGSRVYCSDCNSTCTAGASNGRTCFMENGSWVH